MALCAATRDCGSETASANTKNEVMVKPIHLVLNITIFLSIRICFEEGTPVARVLWQVFVGDTTVARLCYAEGVREFQLRSCCKPTIKKRLKLSNTESV